MVKHRAIFWPIAAAFVISIGFNMFGIWKVNDVSRGRTADNHRFITELARVGNDAILKGCERVNNLRDGLRFVEDAIVALRPKEEAILRDPMSTPEQRADAQQTIEFGMKIHVALTDEKCGKPLPTR